MFKLGRGGGGGGAGRGNGKRPLPPPSLVRPAATAGAARLPIGGARNRPGAPPVPGGGGGGGALPGREESFSLASSGELDFAAIIRLTPDLVEEIRRVEAQGGVAKIKFDSNTNLPSGNVIDVGGKEFRFTCSREPGDLCDIYEERRSGEDGDGLLVECGSAWCKLNVDRILDESTKNHVKMRSEEAERLLKSRKAIVLDPANPSMKNQVKSMAAAGVEGNMRRMGWKQKKEPFFKKRKVEPNQGPPKSVFKSVTASNRTTKGVLSVSPISSPPEKSAPGTSASPFGTGISSRGDASPEEIIPPLNINKEHIGTGNLEKEGPTKVVHGPKYEVIGHEGGTGDQPEDLQSILITLLSQNPKGMSLKALEKAVGETIPNSAKKIDSIIKNIATVQAPGRYFLKPGMELESSKRRASESGSSPESAHDHTSVLESIFGEKATNENFEHQDQLSSKVEEPDPFEQIDIIQDNPDPLTSDRKASNDSEGRASSSDSGSDSESESDSSDSGSDSGSQSRSRSKSRSPVGSASASSSDSETDGSSSSKEGSDVDVDIMTSEDEKEEAEPKAEATDLKLSSSPRACRPSGGEDEQIDIMGRNQEGQVASPTNLNDFGRDEEMVHAVEDAKVFPIERNIKTSENPETKTTTSMDSDPFRANSRFAVEGIPFSPDQHKQSEDQRLSYVKSSFSTNGRVVKKGVNEKQPILKERSGHEQTEKIPKAKSKRASGSEYFQEKPESTKRSKAANSAEVMPFGRSKEATVSTNSHYISPDISKQDQHKSNNVEWGGNRDIDSQLYSLADRGRSIAMGNTQKMQRSPEFRSSSSLDAEQPGPRTGDLSGRKKTLDRINKNTEGMSVCPDTVLKDKMYKDIRDESTVGDKLSSIPDSYNRKSGDLYGNLKDNGPPLHIRKSDVNKSPVSGKGSVLRRELSDLELGEFREPPAGEEIGGVKRQFERIGSFKSSENKINATDNSNLDISKGRSASHPLLESKKQSSPNLRGGVHVSQEGFYRKMPADDLVDSTRAQPKTMPSQYQQSSRVDHADSEVMSHLNTSAELARCETRTSQGMGLENHAGAHKKTPASMLPQHDIKPGGQKGYQNAKESKPQKSNILGDSTDWSNNRISIENDTNCRRRESSSEDDNSFYSKYDKEEPELRGPIKDYSQYKEYVQEYREKYDCYISLNKNLENIRNDFLKVGEELELAKGRDLEEYYKVVDHLREMYHQHGARNKQMKKVFILLHEELKTLKQRIKDFAEVYERDKNISVCSLLPY